MRKIFFLLVSLLLSSCVINGNFQGLYSHYTKTCKENPELFPERDSSQSLCNLERNNSPSIYLINGIELKACLSQYEKSMVFIWGPNCHGKYCFSPTVVQRVCTEKGMELFIVAEYFDNEKMSIDYDIKRPIFGIDFKYYKTNRTSKYLEKFKADLTGTDTTNGRILYFENGKFIKSSSEL